MPKIRFFKNDISAIATLFLSYIMYKVIIRPKSIYWMVNLQCIMLCPAVIKVKCFDLI